MSIDRLSGSGTDMPACHDRAAVADADCPPHLQPLLAVVNAAIVSCPPPARADMADYLSTILRLEPRRLATQIVTLKPSLTDKRIAAMVGVSRTTLYTWPEYVRARAASKPRRPLARCAVDDDDDDSALDDWE